MAAWTKAEFTELLEKPTLSDEELARALATRTAGAVAAVRGGVDAWHRGMNHSMLNQMMVGYLNQSPRPRYRCARCGGQV
jgi:hypothetical protein